VPVKEDFARDYRQQLLSPFSLYGRSVFATHFRSACTYVCFQKTASILVIFSQDGEKRFRREHFESFFVGFNEVAVKLSKGAAGNIFSPPC
jgi:hypothetical protein